MDGNDLGMIARVFMFLLKGLKYVLKLVWFTGLWWFCVPLVVGIGYEEITGTFIQNNQIMDGIFTILWYACYVLCPLNFLQNIIRMVKKDRKFSFLELLLHNRQKKGFEAKLGGDTVALKTAKDLSGVVFGKAAMQNRGAKERAEEVKAAFLEAAKQIPADQRQEILDRMGQQKEIPTMGRLQYYQAEAEARRQLDTALKQEAQTRERNRTHDRDRGI